MSKNYILNLETNKIELHFEKAEYIVLSAELKTELKRFYLWSKSANAWVSRSTKDHYWAIKTAKKLGFTEKEITGERLSFAEQVERKAEKAEHRAERFETYSDNAERKGKAMQAELESYRGDIAFFTQPIISGHSGSQSFANRRQRIFDRYYKGFEEYKKSEYFLSRAETARETAEMTKYKNPVYLDNRIREVKSDIRDIERKLKQAEETNNNEWQERLLDLLEQDIDKLGYLENCLSEVSKTLEENGRKLYTKTDIKPGYLINVRGSWAKVLKVNPKTVEGDYLESHLKGCFCTCPYAEIAEIKIPEDWTEQKETLENPFKENDIVCKYRSADNSVYMAFQVVKTTEKSVTIQSIKIEGHKPVLNAFTSDKQERRQVKKDRSGNFVLNHNDWYLYKYTEQTAK